MLLTNCIGDWASNNGGSPSKRTKTVMTVDVMAVTRTIGVGEDTGRLSGIISSSPKFGIK